MQYLSSGTEGSIFSDFELSWLKKGLNVLMATLFEHNLLCISNLDQPLIILLCSLLPPNLKRSPLCCCILEVWSSHSMKGSRPPREAFSLTMTNEEQAVMFGGITPSGDLSDETHVLNLRTMVSC